MSKGFFPILISFIFLFTCSNPKDTKKIFEVKCENLQSGIINYDSKIVCKELNKLVVDLNPKVNSNDECGHRENLDVLINRINSGCDDINVILLCYACIETLPPQSEILLTTDSLGTSIQRIVDILTPSNDILDCRRIHAYY